MNKHYNAIQNGLLAALSLLAASSLLAVACTTTDTLRTQADRATYDVIAPEYQRYVEADPTMTETDKMNRLGLLNDWRVRVQAHEGPLQ